ncbi:hypothetical protein ACE2MO_005096, partial [Salmonella enterica]
MAIIYDVGLSTLYRK